MDREMLKEELLGILNKVLAFRAAMEGSDSSGPWWKMVEPTLSSGAIKLASLAQGANSWLNKVKAQQAIYPRRGGVCVCVGGGGGGGGGAGLTDGKVKKGLLEVVPSPPKVHPPPPPPPPFLLSLCGPQ